MINIREPCIAVVDDDDFVSEPIRLLLELHGWEAKTYNSCEAFLDALDKDNPPTCIVLDLYFPGMNGVDLQRSLSRMQIAIPTIVLTARPDGSLAPLSIDAGALEIITKPVKGHDLIKKIEVAMNVCTSK